MFVTKVKSSAALVLATSLLASGALAGAVWSGKELGPGGAGSVSGKRGVQGQVLDREGKPFVGAKLYLGGSAGPKEAEYPVRATSGADGRFEFSCANSELGKTDSEAGQPQLIAVADGYGFGWAKLGAASGEVTLRLIKDAAVSGRILDADGKPVAGATLKVDGITTLSDPKREGLAVAYDTEPFGDYDQDLAKGWAGPLPGQPAVLTTDGKGQYRMAGIGLDRVLFLHLQGPGIAVADLEVISGAPADYQARASRPIRGVVRDQETGKPVAGVSVFRDFWGITRWGKAVTDKEGHYELLGMAKAPAYALKVEPAKGQPYFSCNMRLEDTPGLDALTADVELVQGKVMVTGKVTDKATGKPLAEVHVDYLPLYPNDAVAKMANSSGPSTSATTGTDGSYTLAVMAGPGAIGVRSNAVDIYMQAYVTSDEIKGFFKAPVQRLEVAVGGIFASVFPTGSYNTVVLLEPGSEENKLVKDVSLKPALERKGRVVGPDGEAITGVKVWGLSSQWYNSQTLKGADFAIRGLNPTTDRRLTFQHGEKNLAAAITAKGAEATAELTVRLQPCGSFCGRILDQDGQPVAGLHIEFWPNDLPGERPQCITDKDGRFRADGALPKQTHTVMHIKKQGPAYGIVDRVAAEPGKVKDLGDITLPNY
jgi:protocatechuate 3,4-dioxygenase beta subunit